MKKKDYQRPTMSVYQLAMQQPLMNISGNNAPIYEDEVDTEDVL